MRGEHLDVCDNCKHWRPRYPIAGGFCRSGQFPGYTVRTNKRFSCIFWEEREEDYEELRRQRDDLLDALEDLRDYHIGPRTVLGVGEGGIEILRAGSLIYIGEELESRLEEKAEAAIARAKTRRGAGRSILGEGDDDKG